MQKYINNKFIHNNNNNSNITVPLFNVEAEMYVIGAVLKNPSILNKIMSIIDKPEIFYVTEHRLIWKAIISLNMRGLIPSKESVVSELETLGYLQEVGKETVNQIILGTVSISNVETFAKIVREKADMRLISKTAENVLKNIGIEPLDILEAKIKNAFASVYKEKKQTKEEILQELIQEIQNPNKNNLYTGFKFIDSFFSLEKGTMNVIASRPGVGKTTLSLNIALNLAMQGIKVSFASLEMTEKELINRLSIIYSGIPAKNVYSESEKRDKIEAIRKIISLPIVIEDNLPPTLYSVESFIDKEKAEGSQLIFIDHLQLIRDPLYRKSSIVGEVTEITHALKAKAQELKIPIIVLSQLNRKIETRENKLPSLSDLRDSGSIEQDADTVTFLVPDKEVPEIINVFVSKNRNGKTGIAKAVFLKDVLMFKEPKYLSPDSDLVF